MNPKNYFRMNLISIDKQLRKNDGACKSIECEEPIGNE